MVDKMAVLWADQRVASMDDTTERQKVHQSACWKADMKAQSTVDPSAAKKAVRTVPRMDSWTAQSKVYSLAPLMAVQSAVMKVQWTVVQLGHLKALLRVKQMVPKTAHPTDAQLV